MVAKKPQVISPKNGPKKEVALFWDYENVPVPKQKGKMFLRALRNFFQHHPPARARIYAHKEALPNDILKDIRRVGPFRVKWVMGMEANAADEVMIRSTRDTLKAQPNLPLLVLITGDGDFQELLGELGGGIGRTILICGQQNYNYRLFKQTYHAFSTIYIANHPSDWWKKPTAGRKFIGL
jgi:hypothetical protein